jgi:uncharacterized protein
MWPKIVELFADPQTWMFITVGFAAQMCDGMLGMGFGVISSAVLTVLGLTREVVSASVNGAKLFTGTVSAISHSFFGNIAWRAFAVLALGGIVGGVAGAWLITVGIGWFVGVLVSVYLVLVGLYIIWKTSHVERLQISAARTSGVGFAGGTMEALAGVWGPLVTSNLVALGLSPRFAVGTGNFAETVVAVAVFTVLVHHIGFSQLSQQVIGLILGAVVASPMAARLTVNIPKRRLTIGVGILVIVMGVIRLVRDLA